MAIQDEQGRWIDAQGKPIPVRYVDQSDKMRDRLVMKLARQAEKLSRQITDFKITAFDEIEKYLDRLEKMYNINSRTKVGNKVLTDFSNTMKIEIRVIKLIDFDDRLILAKSIIDDCIKRWSKGANDKLLLLVEEAFKVDNRGKLDKTRIMALRRWNIQDEQWRKAMDIIADSIKVVNTKSYIRFSVKNEKGDWEAIPLDIAKC